VGAPEFDIVFREHVDTIFRYFARRVSRHDAADLTAETFRLAYGAWDRFDHNQPSARPWLYGIAGNVLRHHVRSAGRERAALDRVGAVRAPDTDALGAVDAAIDAAQAWPAVRDALARLSPSDREALLLFSWEELSYTEIAVATQVPIGTVRSRINRARRLVCELIGLDGQHPVDTPPHTRQEATEHAEH
jgi:RNA polymerase sigma factor (sigma-70 family)